MMRLRHLAAAFLALGAPMLVVASALVPALVPALAPALAQTAEQAQQQRGIQGSDVMGDRSRGGPDGWSWAPVTRSQAPSGQAAGEPVPGSSATPNTQPAGDVGKNLAPGQDPGTPARTEPSGPGTQDTAGAPRRP